ncbi:SEC-C domain-containing protein [Ideonella sp. 4Y16]|uniref:SEC-C domain-containing protein n=1 Tax=Ideonella alba TaxID=2824118 RepID=UPI001B384815|nr:SEC-C domain-containing protein [Ideonella alba]MBQ0943432.1 SEC-C domain-containing protein [Ideonella alba]
MREYLQNSPGDMVLGWDVTVWEGVLLNCIGHAVVRNGDEFLCVTPSKYPERKLLFLPDPSLTFDFEDDNARLPVREIALSSRPEVFKLIEVTMLERQIKVKYPVSSKPTLVQGQDAVEIQRLGQMKSQLMLRVILVTADHNTRCPCGSGKKFRKCHRSDVERMLS